jgi:hypothetical protein
MSNELLAKAAEANTTLTGSMVGAANPTDGIHVGSEGKGGLLNPEQSARFLDYMFDATVVGKLARTVRMRADTTEIDRIGVGEKLMKLAAEAENTGSNAAVQFSKISLTTKKLRLDWELSTESLEDNIEGADLEDHIARLMATQAGNDLEDVVLNGDTSLSSDNLYKAFDGIVKIAKANGHVVDADGDEISRNVFNNALKALPRKYKQRRPDLRFLSGSNLIQDYLYSTSQNISNVNPQDIAASIIRGETAGLGGPAGFTAPFAFGIPIVEVPLLKEDQAGGAPGELRGDIHLTFPNNVVIGIKRDVTVYRFFWPKKDSIEYTMYTRVGCQIEQADAWVVVKNVKVAS